MGKTIRVMLHIIKDKRIDKCINVRRVKLPNFSVSIGTLIKAVLPLVGPEVTDCLIDDGFGFFAPDREFTFNVIKDTITLNYYHNQNLYRDLINPGVDTSPMKGELKYLRSLYCMK